MTLAETEELLRFVASLDGRNPTDLAVAAWHAVLDDLDAAEVWEAVREHFTGTDPAWLQPQHIRRHVRAKRLSAPPPVDRVLPDGEPASPEVSARYREEINAILARSRFASDAEGEHSALPEPEGST